MLTYEQQLDADPEWALREGSMQPVAFPDPTGRSIDVDGIPVLRLPELIELKLASGMTRITRMKDLADVIELIRILKLPEAFAGQLNPYVRPKFLELWSAVQRESAGETPKAP